MANHDTNVVYIDTNLDTRFALLVSDLDTVSDLKRSILSEHPLCFPQIGQIQINAIKVMREGNFYHLVDSMPVRSAFTDSRKSWLVSVDATALRECAQNDQMATLGIVRNTLTGRGDNAIGSPSKGVSTFGNFKLLQLENNPVENEEVVVPSPRVSQHTSKVADEKLDAGVKSSIENGEYPGSAVEDEFDGTNKGTGAVGVVRKEGNCESVSNLNRKRKSKRKREDAVRDDTSNVDDASVVGLGDCAIQQDVEVVAKTVEDENREVIMEVEVLKEHQHNDCNNSNTKSDIGTAVSMKEAAEPGLTGNMKRKKKKRTLSVDFKEVFKVEEASLKDEKHKSNEAHKERKESKDRFEFKNHNYRYDVEYKDDKVTGANLDTETPAKKKRKRSKEKSEETSSSKAKLINDFNVDISPHHDLGDPQKIKNSNDDQLAEKFNGTDPLKTIVEGRRRKGKVNSSNPQETPVLTSSTNVEEAYHSSIRKGGQEEISLSKGPDMSMGKSTIDNMETGTDAFKEGIQSTEKTTGNYKNDSGIEIIAHPANEDGPMELTEDNAKNEAPQIEGAEEGREVSSENDPKLMLLDKSTPSNSDAKVGGLNVTSKVVDVNGTPESIKLKKVKKKKKTAKNSDGESTFREVIGCVDASKSKTVIMKSLSATNCDSKSGNTETEEDPLNKIEGGKIQQEMQGISDKEVDFNIDCAEHTGKRQRKKSNDKKTSISKSLSNMLLKDQVLDSKDSSPSSNSKTHAKSSVAVTKKSNSASTKSTKKSCKTDMEPGKDSVRLEPSARFNSGSKDAVQLSAHTPGEKDDDNLEAPSKTLKVNADGQFSSWKQPAEANLSDAMVVDKLIEADINDIEPMTRNNIHQLEATNGQTPKDLSSSQKLSSKEELDVRIHPGEKVPNAHRTGQDSKVSGNSAVIVENKKTRVNASEKKMASEKQRKRVPVSNSKLEGSIKGVQNKAGKASGNNVRGAVGKTPQKKSLLSGAIFKDDSSSSSDDEVGNSGASTRTPSDNPLLSDGDSSSGSYGGRNLENGGRSSSKAGLTETEGMSIDDVLRSSSWFKKAQAKLTASQLQESQSQSPEFVPDSLAD
ncbi:hypothetical protein VNO80_04989 [Phaseolus coccineus]|uniref:Uncharacterized protein n=1 Tax=Phaseolus coccineus TaxID=3886 RepID=A0AAN9NUT8_PHACN